MYNIPVVNRNITHKLRSAAAAVVRCVVAHISLGNRTLIRSPVRMYGCVYVILHRNKHGQRHRMACATMCTENGEWVAVTIHRIWTLQYYCILNLIHAYQNRRRKNLSSSWSLCVIQAKTVPFFFETFIFSLCAVADADAICAVVVVPAVF